MSLFEVVWVEWSWQNVWHRFVQVSGCTDYSKEVAPVLVQEVQDETESTLSSEANVSEKSSIHIDFKYGKLKQFH